MKCNIQSILLIESFLNRLDCNFNCLLVFLMMDLLENCSRLKRISKRFVSAKLRGIKKITPEEPGQRLPKRKVFVFKVFTPFLLVCDFIS